MRNFGLTGLLMLSLSIGACGGGEDKAALDELDTKLGRKDDADPALTAALEDQILVDRSLSGQSNEDSIRPAGEPNQSPIPAGRDAAITGITDTAGQTLGGLAAEQSVGTNKDRFAGCSLDVQYSMQWATRLPAELPLYPQARVIEAGGSDTDRCKLRAVTFASSAPPGKIVDFYLLLAKRAKFSSGQKASEREVTVSGTRQQDGSAFYAIVTPNGSGSNVDLVSNRGR